MALQKERTYLVLNYNASPVALSTKNGSYLLAGGSRENPAILPLTIEEIITSNSNGCAYKYGLAWFEEEFQEDIYAEIRLNNWRSILRDEEIEEIIMCPTKEGLEKIIAIDNEIYFARVDGIYTGLKSVFAEISPKVEIIIEQRRSELRNNKRKSEIIVSKQNHVVPEENSEVNLLKQQNELLLKQMEEMKKMFEASMAHKADSTEEKKTAGRPAKK